MCFETYEEFKEIGSDIMSKELIKTQMKDTLLRTDENKVNDALYKYKVCIKRDINKREEGEIKTIIRRNKQKLSTEKTIRYVINKYKKVTGFVISPNNKLVIPNKIKSKIKVQTKFIRKKETDIHNKNKIIDLTNFADISIKGKYIGLRETVNKLKIIENVQIKFWAFYYEKIIFI